MKTKLTLLKKLKVCFTFLIHDDFTSCLIEQCPNCKSIKISKLRSSEQVYSKGSEYHAYYQCNDCGSEAKAIEEWYFDSK